MTVNANLVQRTKNCLTKDKIYMIIKTNCEVNSKNICWSLTDAALEKHKTNKLKFSDVFKGDPPLFGQTFGRGQFSKSTSRLNESLSNNKSLASSPGSKSKKKPSLSNIQSSNAKHKGSPANTSKNSGKNSKNAASSSKKTPSKSTGGNTSTRSIGGSPSKISDEKKVNVKRIAQIMAKKGNKQFNFRG